MTDTTGAEPPAETTEPPAQPPLSPPPPPEWLGNFERSLARGDPLGASDVLRKSGINGFVSKENFDQAAAVVDRIGPAPTVRFDWAERLMAHPRRVDKELAAAITGPLARTHRREVAKIAARLARDDDKEVRDTAAVLFARLLTESFTDGLPLAREWATGPESRLRRAALVAAKYAARTRKPEWAEPLLDLLELALHDPDEYVRKSLGPSALGDQFVRSYPDATLARLRRWMQDEDENVRWNVAMTFSAASGARLAQRAPDVLEFLADDERPFVRDAVRAAQRRVRTLVA